MIKIFPYVFSVIGTPFYVMDHVAGRVFTDITLAGLSFSDRQQIYAEMSNVLSKIHKVDLKKADLLDFGKIGI